MRLSYRWFHWFYLFLAPLVVGPILWGAGLYTLHQRGQFELSLLLLFLVNSAAAYVVLMIWFNRTTLSIKGRAIQVAHGPFPCPSKKLEVADDEHFGVKTWRRGTSKLNVRLVLRKEGWTREVTSLPTPGKAEDWARQLNEYLGITPDSEDKK